MSIHLLDRSHASCCLCLLQPGSLLGCLAGDSRRSPGSWRLGLSPQWELGGCSVVGPGCWRAPEAPGSVLTAVLTLARTRIWPPVWAQPYSWGSGLGTGSRGHQTTTPALSCFNLSVASPQAWGPERRGPSPEESLGSPASDPRPSPSSSLPGPPSSPWVLPVAPLGSPGLAVQPGTRSSSAAYRVVLT